MKIDLFDLPSDKIYIQLEEEFHKRLFKMAITKVGSQSKLAEILKSSGEKFAKDLKNIRQQEISGWYHNYRFLRLDILKFLLEFINLHVSESDLKIDAIKGIGTSKPINNPKFPITLDYEMAQLLGKMCGDGCVTDKYSYTTTYLNSSEELVDEFKKLINEKFGDIEFHEDINNGVKAITITGTVGKIITDFFDFKHSKRVPCCIIEENKDIKRGFLHAIFDDEGTVSSVNGQIKLKMLHKSFLEGIKKLLLEFNITTSKIDKDESKRYGGPLYYFTISGQKNFKNFYDNIGFTHYSKRKRLENRLNSYKMNQYQKGEPHKIIINILANCGPKTAKDLAEELNRTKRTIQFHLNNLIKKKIVKFTKVKRKFVYEYLWMVNK